MPGFRRDGSRRSARPAEEEGGRGQGSDGLPPSPGLSSLSPLAAVAARLGAACAPPRGGHRERRPQHPRGSRTQRGACFHPALSIFALKEKTPPSSWCPPSLMSAPEPGLNRIHTALGCRLHSELLFPIETPHLVFSCCTWNKATECMHPPPHQCVP